MDEYVRTLKLKLAAEFDKNKLDDVRKEFNNLEAVKLGVIDNSSLEKAKQSFEEIKKKEFEIAKLEKAISEIQMFDKDTAHLSAMQSMLAKLKDEKEDIEIESKTSKKGFGGGFKDAFNEWKDNVKMNLSDFAGMGRQAFSDMKDAIVDFGKKALASIESFVSDAITSIKEMAKWNISESNTYNPEAVSLYMETGLQGADAYGLNAALKSQNFSSMQDFYEAMPFMTKQQLDYMEENLEIAKKNYENSIDTAMKFEEFSNEYDLFKKELQSELINFFTENSDTIKAFLELGIKAMEFTIKFFGWIMSKFSKGSERTDSERKQAVADILNVSSSSLTNANNSKTVNMSNTYNGVSKADQSWLANVGQMTYLQIIEALK